METALTLVSELLPLKAQITDFYIDNDTVNEAAEFRSSLKAFRKRVESAEEETARPLKTAWEAAREPFLDLRKQIDATEKLLNKRLSDWNLAENARRAEADRKERERQRLALEAVQKEAEQKGDIETVIAMETAVTHVENMPQQNKLKSVDTGKAKLSFRDNWKFEVGQFDKIPDEYTVRAINEAAIMRAIAAGVRQIPGLIIYNEPVPVGR